MTILLQLFWEFMKVGLFSIGGGMATLPFLSKMGEATQWFTQAQLADMIAISESTPGPIGINMATYVGFTTAGVPGAIIASLGIVVPAIMIVLIVARLLTSFKENRFVQGAFYGLRPASVGLIAAAGFSVLKISLLNLPAYQASGNILDAVQWMGLALAVVIYFVMLKWKKLHPVVVIAASAVIGVVFHFGGV